MWRSILMVSLFATAFAGVATGACAQPLAHDADLFAAVRAPASARPPAAFAIPAPSAAQRSAPGVAQTAIDRPLAGGRLAGSLGFLCGLQPTPAANGPASAYGVDEQGRFLGAKLHFAFR